MLYENKVEVAVNPQHVERIQRLRQYFIEDPQVRKHFESPGEAWDAAMLPQDGGVTRIISAIDRVSDPAFRAKNLHEKSAKIAESLSFRLKQYFNEGGDKEVA